MFVCIDKVTCARMLQRIQPRWQFKVSELNARIPKLEAELLGSSSPDERERLSKSLERMRGQAKWMEDTIIEIESAGARMRCATQKWDWTSFRIGLS
jgi:type I restriction enzyme R subunit